MLNDYAMLYCSRNVPFMLMKLSNYVQKLILGCSWGARKWSISDGQIRLADGVHELAVVGKSLDSVGCSLSLDSLTET